MPEPLTVLLADSNSTQRAALRAVLSGSGFHVCAEARDAAEAVRLARTGNPPAFCLVDAHLEGGVVQATSELLQQLPGTSVVVLAPSEDDGQLLAALRAGAVGYLTKDLEPGSLAAALRGVLNGEAAVPRRFVVRLLDELRRDRPHLARRRPGSALDRLTSREWQIMDLLSTGATTEEIADELFLSASTVRVHISRLLKKLRVPDRDAAVRRYRDEA